MLISRRSALAYGSSALAAGQISPTAAVAAVPAPPKAIQKVQQPLIHRDETGGDGYSAALAIPAGNTAWVASGVLTEAGYRAASLDYGLRGYGLRRLNAFHTRSGMRYAAIWQLGHGATIRARHGMTEDQFRREVATRAGQVLAHVDATATPAGTRFAAIWEETQGPAQKVLTGLSSTDFELQRVAMAGASYRLRQLAGYAENGAARLAAVFEKRDGPRQEIFAAMPAREFAALSVAMTHNGLLLRDASGYVVSGKPYHTAIWEA